MCMSWFTSNSSSGCPEGAFNVFLTTDDIVQCVGGIKGMHLMLSHSDIPQLFNYC